MAWIFQGNPARYDIDEYVARFPQLVYWSAPRFRAEISVGDRAYIWRSGDDAGAIASGVIVETAVPAPRVIHPEALGDDLWVQDAPDEKDYKVGIALESIRLTAGEGMLSRSVLKDDVLLSASTIMRMPSGTVFRLDEEQSKQMDALWSQSQVDDDLIASVPTALEGRVELVAHRRRERSRLLVSKKREMMRASTGSLACEICGLGESAPYPQSLAASVFEVHHRVPLSLATAPKHTSLDDLAVVCANCHRAVHATRDVERNFTDLVAAFGQKT